MKHADQNQMDLLLRSLGRRGGGPSDPIRDQGLSRHLDADELNAFAEGMLPDRARARYSEHLADCSSCRSVIIQLSQTAGVSVSRQATEERPRATFWERLAQIFAQPVLRYALPAVVLISLLGIGMLVLREQRQEQFIAQHQPTLEQAPQPNVNSSNQAVPSQTPPQPSSEVSPTTRGLVASVPVDAPRGESTDRAADSTPPPIAGVARKEADAQPGEPTPTFAPDLNASAAPPPMPGYAARDRAATLSKEALKREAEQAQDEVKVQTSRTDDQSNAAPAAAKAAGSRARTGTVQGLMTERRSYEDKNKKDSDSRESRTVSGKRFVRQNDSWIDSSYKSSATTNVKRGSEQYRALIADEPGLRAFAEQLSGEVIVVWKSRAYRFY